MSHVKRTWQVENTWNCASCSRRNKGRYMNCQFCGARKDHVVQDNPVGPEAPEVTDPELLRQATAGANWECEYCGGQERNLEGNCTQCGGPKAHEFDGGGKEYQEVKYRREGGATVRNVRAGGDIIVTSTRRPEPTRVPGPGVKLNATDEDFPKAQVGNLNPEPLWRRLVRFGSRQVFGPLRRWRLRYWQLALTLAIGGLTWFGIWLCTPRVVDARVSMITWTYTEHLRARQQRHGSGWDRPGPRGFYGEPAFNVSCESRYYGDVDCHPHDCNPHSESYSCNCSSYECDCTESCTSNRNGFSTCTEECEECEECQTCYRTVYDTCYDRCPVYKDWCNYDYYDWPVVGTKILDGNDHNVQWPNMVPENNLERVEKLQAYDVNFTSDDGAYVYHPKSLTDYDRFNIGDAWRLRVGKIRDHHIESLERKR